MTRVRAREACVLDRLGLNGAGEAPWPRELGNGGAVRLSTETQQSTEGGVTLNSAAASKRRTCSERDVSIRHRSGESCAHQNYLTECFPAAGCECFESRNTENAEFKLSSFADLSVVGEMTRARGASWRGEGMK